MADNVKPKNDIDSSKHGQTNDMNIQPHLNGSPGPCTDCNPSRPCPHPPAGSVLARVGAASQQPARLHGFLRTSLCALGLFITRIKDYFTCLEVPATT